MIEGSIIEGGHGVDTPGIADTRLAASLYSNRAFVRFKLATLKRQHSVPDAASAAGAADAAGAAGAAGEASEKTFEIAALKNAREDALEDALEDAEQAAVRDPAFAKAHYRCAQILAALERDRAAVDALCIARQFTPEDKSVDGLLLKVCEPYSAARRVIAGFDAKVEVMRGHLDGMLDERHQQSLRFGFIRKVGWLID